MMWKDVLDEVRGLETGRRSLRSFAWVVGGVFLGISALVLWHHEGQPTMAVRWLGGIGAALVVTGALVPAALVPLYRVWMGAALLVGYVMTRVILTLVFYCMMTPLGWVMRLSGRDPLNRSFPSGEESHWIRRDPASKSPERLTKYY